MTKLRSLWGWVSMTEMDMLPVGHFTFFEPYFRHQTVRTRKTVTTVLY